MPDKVLSISSGMPHISAERKQQINDFAGFVSFLPWFNMDMLHKLYHNLFLKGLVKIAQDLKPKELFETRAITCADLINSPRIIRINYNAFRMDNELRLILRSQLQKKHKLVREIGSFMVAYTQECAHHILSAAYREVLRIEGLILIDPSKAVHHIFDKIHQQFQPTLTQSAGKKMISFWLDILDQTSGNDQFKDQKQILESYLDLIENKTDEALKKLKNLQENETEDGITVTLKLPKYIRQALLDNIGQIQFRAEKENFLDKICLIEKGLTKQHATGVFINQNYILTVNHIIENKEAASNSIVIRDFDNDESQEVKLLPEEFFFTDPVLDFTIIKCSFDAQASKNNQAFLSFSNAEPPLNTSLYSIFFNSEKEMEVAQGKLLERSDLSIDYDLITGAGSSGAPIINEQNEIIGIHIGRINDSQATQAPTRRGIPIQTIKNRLLEQGLQLDNLEHSISIKEQEGYNPLFLSPDHQITLPKISPQLSHLIAEVEGRDDGVLHYPHHSIVMNKERKMAFFSAAMVMEKNKSFNFSRSPYKKDKRIKADYQFGNNFSSFKNNINRTALIKRTDVSWGTAKKAQDASEAIYQYTNIVPQIGNLTRTNWKNLEQNIQKRLELNNQKAIIIAGPIFYDEDPVYIANSYQIPIAFWKVIYFKDQNGSIRRCCFLATQLEVLGYREVNISAKDTHPLRSSIFRDETLYQVDTKEIEAMTQLKFTPAEEIWEGDFFDGLEYTKIPAGQSIFGDQFTFYTEQELFNIIKNTPEFENESPNAALLIFQNSNQQTC